MHHDFGFTLLKQRRHTVDLHARESATDVIGMRVRHERVRDFHLVLLRDLENRIDFPSGIDDRDFASFGRTDQVDVILHRPDLELFEVESTVHL